MGRGTLKWVLATFIMAGLGLNFAPLVIAAVAGLLVLICLDLYTYLGQRQLKSRLLREGLETAGTVSSAQESGMGNFQIIYTYVDHQGHYHAGEATVRSKRSLEAGLEGLVRYDPQNPDKSIWTGQEVQRPSLPVPRWLPPHENPFGIEVLDCSPVVLGVIATTADPDIAARFAALRSSSGEEFRDTQPKGARSIQCDLTYPHEGQPKDGPVFKAEEMEDKWDIYLYNGYLYFSRSWTGELMFRAKIEFGEETAHVDTIETGSKGEDALVVRQVDFLIKRHVYGLEVPHPLPKDLGRDSQKLAVYSFQLYGQRGLYGSFSDTLGVR